MAAKISFLCIVSLGVIFLGTINQCLAETGDDLEQARQRILALIQSGDSAGADTATNKLIADFNNSPGINDTVHQVALKYQEVKNYQKEIELSMTIIRNWPDANHAVWSQMDIVMANLYLHNESAAKAEIGTLISRYKDDPDLPKALSIIGREYRKEDFGQILKQNFNAESPAKVRLAILNADIIAKVESGDFGSAGRGVDRMMAEFSSDADLPEMLLIIAQQLSWWHQYEQAGSIYQQIVQRFPDSPSAVKASQCVSKTGQISNIVSKLIDSGDYGKVKKAVEELIEKFGGEEDAPSTIYDIAGKLESAGQFALARQIFDEVVWQYPKDKFADLSRIGALRAKGLALDESGDEAGAKSAFDGIPNDFKGHPYLPANLMRTAEGYYRRACKAELQGDSARSKKLFDKALQTLNVVLTQFPASEEVPNACYVAGDCYYKLGRYEDSLRCFQTIVNNHSTFKYAWYAQFMVGSTYQKMKDKGLLSESDADAMTKTAYQQLISKWPGCDNAGGAQEWLNEHNSK